MAVILYLYENETTTISLTRKAFQEEIGNDNVTKTLLSSRSVSTQDLNSSDVIVLVRPTDCMLYAIAKRAKQKQRMVITYCDDDLYNSPQNSFLEKQRVRYFRMTLSISDALITSSPRLAEKYRDFIAGKRTVVQNTTVYNSEIREHRDEGDEIKIVYAAGECHKSIFERNVTPVLGKLVGEIGKKFSLTFVGVSPSVGDIEKDIQVNRVGPMPLDEYREFMYANNFDIGLAPLDQDEFSQCKYYNKFIEYSICGIMGIYANDIPYTYIVQDRENGLLADSTPESWLEKMIVAITDKQLRTNCTQQAQAQLKKDFSAKQVLGKLYSQIPEMVQQHNDQRPPLFGTAMLLFIRARYQIENAVIYGVTSCEYLKSEGLAKLFSKAMWHIRRRKELRV